MNPAAAVTASSQSVMRDYIQLMKPRISVLAAIMAVGGYYMADGMLGAVSGAIHVLVGTLLVTGGACVLNQYLERDADALMNRTRNRPLAAGTISEASGFFMGVILSAAGVLYLTFLCNFMAGAIGAFALVSYVFWYTPLKRRTSLCTIVGAVPGALPPVIGWGASRGELNFESFVLFSIMFLWQLPHFVAIAWIYREDYARAGMPMLTLIGANGDFAARQMMIHTVALLAVSLLPTLAGLTGLVYVTAAVVSGTAYLWLCMRWVRCRDNQRARHVFLASLLHIVLLFAFMVLDKLPS